MCVNRNLRGPYAKFRLFEDIEDVDLTPDAVQEMMQDAKFASAIIAMKAGRYEEAVKGFEKLTTPYASFYMAQVGTEKGWGGGGGGGGGLISSDVGLTY